MTQQNFVTQLLRSKGNIQFREPDKHTTDYTYYKKALGKGEHKEYVEKSSWSGERHEYKLEKELSIQEAVNEIINRVERKS